MQFYGVSRWIGQKCLTGAADRHRIAHPHADGTQFGDSGVQVIDEYGEVLAAGSRRIAW